MDLPETTPVLVGVGQIVERLDATDYVGRSPAELAAMATEQAIDDARGRAVANAIEMVGAVRTFEDSTSRPSAFGKPNKYPLAVAARVGVTPRVAVLDKAGGQSPLAIIAEIADRIARGELSAGLAFGSEAISTIRHLQTQGEKRDWSETLAGEMDDRGRGVDGLIVRHNVLHGVTMAPAAYGLLENARRARLGIDRESYRMKMAELFAPFTHVAGNNPYASSRVMPMDALKIATIGERNRMISDPYPLRLVARDQVNMAAAAVIMSIGKARELGIPEERWIYIHSCALASDRDILEREDLGSSLVAKLTLESALNGAGLTVDEIGYFDFYSCFPIPVFAAAVDTLGLSPQDPRGLTVTGGLPYFGGAGNNYSMHAIAEMVKRLRGDRAGYGLVGLNGGFISKYGAVVLSARPAAWKPCEQDSLQRMVDRAPRPKTTRMAQGSGRVLTYTINYVKGVPVQGIIIGELTDGTRFLANSADAGTLAEMVEDDPIGREVLVVHRAEGNRFLFDAARLDAVFPQPEPAFRAAYETVLLDRRGHVLEVTLNRPDQCNSITQQAQFELDEVFNAFEADRDLWVAIITGAGEKAFCAGADLKGATKGFTIPLSGFAGLTSRERNKPLIAAVNGIAYGGGFEISLAADMIVADPSARFALSEVKVGVVASAGGAIRLPRQIPRKLAMELLLTGRQMDAEEACRWGFVNRISAPGEALAEARRLADEIASVSPTSVRLTMQAVRESDQYSSDVEAARSALHSTVLDTLAVSEDKEEGLLAFAQKRRPVWVNR